MRSDGSVAYRVCFRYVIAAIFDSLASVTKVSEAFFLLFAFLYSNVMFRDDLIFRA